MTGTLILFPDAQGATLFVQDGTVTARGAAARDNGEDPEVGRVLIAPARSLSIHSLTGGAVTPAQARAAARLELAEQSLIPADDLHVAVSDRDGEPDSSAAMVAFLSASQVRDWIETLRPDAIIPAPLILPKSETGFTRGLIGGEDVLRSADTGFAHDDTITPLVVGNAEVRTLDPAEVEARLIEAASNPPLDLRQGPFAKPRSWSFDKGLIRRAGWLVAALALISLAIPIVEMARLSWNSGTTTDAAAARAQAALGDPAPPADPVAALDARLATSRGGGAGFGATMSAVAQAVKATPNAELVSATFRSDGVLALTARTSIADELRVLQKKLAANGLSVTAKPVNPSLNPPTIDLEVRGQ